MKQRGTTNRNDRGSSYARRARKIYLLIEFGDGYTAPCVTCEIELDFHTITVDRYPIRGCDGGTYAKNNIRPMCGPCNASDGSQEMHRRLGHVLKGAI